MDERDITVELIQRVNNALIERKKYAPHIEAAAERLPRLTPEEINAVWKKANGRAKSDAKV